MNAENTIATAETADIFASVEAKYSLSHESVEKALELAKGLKAAKNLRSAEAKSDMDELVRLTGPRDASRTARQHVQDVLRALSGRKMFMR